MSYGIELTDEAKVDWRSLKVPLQEFVLDELEKLSNAPTLLSRRSFFPFRYTCQRYPFDCDFEEQWWDFNAFFQYSQDEMTLFIVAIGWNRRPPRSQFDDIHRV